MIISTGGVSCASSAQANWIWSKRPSVSPGLVASAGRGGRSADVTLSITNGSVLHEANGTNPVNTWPRVCKPLFHYSEMVRHTSMVTTARTELSGCLSLSVTPKSFVSLIDRDRVWAMVSDSPKSVRQAQPGPLTRVLAFSKRQRMIDLLGSDVSQTYPLGSPWTKS